MSRHDTLIVKETHRGLLYEDGVLREVLPAGRHRIPRPPSSLAAFFGAKGRRVEVVLVDVRGRDRTVVVADLLTAEGATISASFIVQYRVADPLAATHQVRNFEERLYAESQAAARRALRGMTLEEVMGSRDEIGEELFRLVRESAASYGLDVTTLDFKDLILPVEVREALNRAAIARRLRLAPFAGARDDDDAFDSSADGAPAPDDQTEPDREEVGVVLARVDFDRDSREGSMPPRPRGLDPRTGGAAVGGFDGLRRFRS